MNLDSHQLRVAREKLRREKARHADALAVIEREITECLQAICHHPSKVQCRDIRGKAVPLFVCTLCGARQ